jgi:hypothetical protein
MALPNGYGLQAVHARRPVQSRDLIFSGEPSAYAASHPAGGTLVVCPRDERGYSGNGGVWQGMGELAAKALPFSLFQRNRKEGIQLGSGYPTMALSIKNKAFEETARELARITARPSLKPGSRVCAASWSAKDHSPCKATFLARRG